MSRQMLSVSIVLLAVLLAGSARLIPGRAAPAASQASPIAEATPCPTTTEEENEALVRRFHEEAWERGNVEIMDDVWAPTIIFDRSAAPSTSDPEVIKARILEFRTGFPDLQEELAFVVTDEDLVVLSRIRMGTHLGPWDGAEPTGRVVTWTGLDWYRIACGRIVEGGAQSDSLGLRRQLGIITDEELADAGTPTVATPVP